MYIYLKCLVVLVFMAAIFVMLVFVSAGVVFIALAFVVWV